MAEMKIEGLDKLLSQLDSIKNIELSKCALAGAMTLQAASMDNAPVKTGFLRNSHESVEVDNGAEMRVNAEYAYYQEFGWANSPGNPFIRPAIDENTGEILEAIKHESEVQIKEKGGG